MTETSVAYSADAHSPLNDYVDSATMEAGPPDVIFVSRADLLKEYGLAIARAQHLGSLLGLPPVLSGQQRRKMR